MGQPVSRAGEGRNQQGLDREWKQQRVQVAWEVGVGWDHLGGGDSRERMRRYSPSPGHPERARVLAEVAALASVS